MIFYWTTWNFTWFYASYLNFLPFNAPLKCSILATSIIGGYTVYIYPKKLKMKINNHKISIPYPILISGDIIFHQLPLIYCFLYKSRNEDNTCGTLVFAPVSLWFGLNYLFKINMDRLYGIAIKKLFYSSLVIFGGHSLCYHIIRKKLAR